MRKKTLSNKFCMPSLFVDIFPVNKLPCIFGRIDNSEKT